MSSICGNIVFEVTTKGRETASRPKAKRREKRKRERKRRKGRNRRGGRDGHSFVDV